jgi:DNA primase
MVQCPYHGDGQERRPSAGIRKTDGMFHCFACGETHPLTEVISHCFGKDMFGDFGWRWLLQNFGTVSVEERKDVKLDLDRREVSSRNRRSDNSERNSAVPSDQYVSEEELDSYRYFHPYMYKRGLTDEVIELFDIGFDSNTQCITFPIRDINGNCLFVARRSVKTKFFNYPKGVEKPLYGLYELYMCDYPDGYEDYDGVWRTVSHFPSEVIVCESMLDALAFWTVGKYAVALNGLGNDLQFKQLRELPCREIILATDMDERGLDARKRIRKNLQNTKIVTEYFFPDGRKDANDCTKEELLNLKAVF